MGQQMIIIQQAFEQNFHLAAARLGAEQACRNYFGIVQDQQITWPQYLHQVCEKLVLQGACGSIHEQ